MAKAMPHSARNSLARSTQVGLSWSDMAMRSYFIGFVMSLNFEPYNRYRSYRSHIYIYVYMIPASGFVAPPPPEWVGSTQEKGKKQ